MGIDSTLVLLPGLDGTDVFFRPFVAALPAGVRVVVIEYPTVGSNTYPSLLEHVRREIAGLSRIHVVAWSFGGPLAVLLAEAEPERVRGLVLAATFLRAPRLGLVPLRGMVRGPIVGAIRTVRRLPVWFFRRRSDAHRLAKAETWARISSRVLAARTRTLLGADVRSVLAKCSQPVLCVAFNSDEVVPGENADEIAQTHRNVTRVDLAGNHLAFLESPEPLVHAVMLFVRDVDESDPDGCKLIPQHPVAQRRITG